MTDILLRKDWDESHTWDSSLSEGIFIETEAVRKIKEFIKERSSGSLLVSGQRGAGKSTAVIQSIKQIKTTNSKIIPIYVNAIHLEALHEDDNYFLSSLKIIKQLAFSLKNYLQKNRKKVPNKLDLLLHNLELTELVKTYKTTRDSNISLGANIAAEVTKEFLSAGANVEAKSKYSEWAETVAKKIGITLEEIIKDFSIVLEEVELENQPRINKCIEALPLRLGRVYNSLKGWKKNYVKEKIIFILDELDYFDQDDQTISKVLNTLKRIKSLITLSVAQFIFIVGTNTYHKSLSEEEGSTDKFYTIFTDRIFFYKSTGSELLEYINAIIDPNGQFIPHIGTEQNKWLLISKSRHSFYRLKQEIKAQSNYVESERGRYLIVKELNSIDKTRAAIHFALSTIYNIKIQKQNGYECNEELFRKLYEIEEDYVKYSMGYTTTITDIVFQSGIEKLDIEQQASIKSAQKDFIHYLHVLSKRPSDRKEYDALSKMPLEWNLIGKGIKWEDVIKGVLGPIVDEEVKLISEYKDLILLGSSLAGRKIGKLSELHDLFPNAVTSLDGQNIEKIQKAIDEVENTNLINRNLSTVIEGLKLVTDIKSELDSNITQSGSLLIKTEWGKVEHDKQAKEWFMKEPLGDHTNKLASRVTVFPQLEYESFIFSCQVNLSKGSLVNFLLMDIPSKGSELNDSFYMLRLEGRQGEGLTDGILFKPQNGNWSFVNPKNDLTSTKNNEWTKVKIIVDKGRVSFQRKDKKFKIIEEIKLETPIKYIGIGNELGDVGFRKISIAKIKDKDLTNLKPNKPLISPGKSQI